MKKEHLYNKKSRELLQSELRQESFDRITCSFYRYTQIKDPVFFRETQSFFVRPQPGDFVTITDWNLGHWQAEISRQKARNSACQRQKISRRYKKPLISKKKM